MKRTFLLIALLAWSAPQAYEISPIMRGFDGERPESPLAGFTVSRDRSLIAVISQARNLHPDHTARTGRHWLFDMTTGEYRFLAPLGLGQNDFENAARISADNRWVVFAADDTHELDPAVPVWQSDPLYVLLDRNSGAMTAFPRRHDGDYPQTRSHGYHVQSSDTAVSPNGRFAVFRSAIHDLVEGVPQSHMHYYAYDRVADEVVFVHQANHKSSQRGARMPMWFLDDGRFVTSVIDTVDDRLKVVAFATPGAPPVVLYEHPDHDAHAVHVTPDGRHLFVKANQQDLRVDLHTGVAVDTCEGVLTFYSCSFISGSSDDGTTLLFNRRVVDLVRGASIDIPIWGIWLSADGSTVYGTFDNEPVSWPLQVIEPQLSLSMHVDQRGNEYDVTAVVTVTNDTGIELRNSTLGFEHEFFNATFQSDKETCFRQETCSFSLAPGESAEFVVRSVNARAGTNAFTTHLRPLEQWLPEGTRLTKSGSVEVPRATAPTPAPPKLPGTGGGGGGAVGWLLLAGVAAAAGLRRRRTAPGVR